MKFPHFLFTAAMGCALLTSAAHADAGALAIQREDGSRLEVASLETTAQIDIHGLLAEVQLKQRFRNDGTAWQQGEYLLPLPEGAAVHAMTLRLGQRLIVGEIREKEAARAEYAQAVASGRKASLVEAHSTNLFRTALANVAPGETVDVEIRYWQQVDYRDGEFSLHLPLTFTPRYAQQAVLAQPVAPAADDLPQSSAAAAEATTLPPAATQQSTLTTPPVRAGAPTVVINATLDAGLPLENVESSTHALDVQRQGEAYRIALRDSVVAPDRDFVLRWTPRPLAAPTAALLREQAGTEQFALLMLLPATKPGTPLPRELVLVIDTSGSMEGQSILQARAALDLALQHLAPQDFFNVIEFDSDTHALFPRSVPAGADDVQLAREWVANLGADGGTEMLPALQTALRGEAAPGRLRQVVFITDGAVEQADALYTALDTELGAARVFPVGIGSAPNGEFLRKAAELGRGSAVVIRDINEVGAQMEKLFTRLDRPALRDLQLNLPFAAEVYPQRLPDLYAGEPLLLVARLDGTARSGGQIELLGQLAAAPWSQKIGFELHGQAKGLSRLWAQRKLEALEDAQRRGGDAQALRAEATALALKHHLVGRYTSLVAVDRTPQRPADAELQSVEVENATPAGSVAFAQTATSSKLWVALAALCLLLALALRRAPAARNGLAA